MTRKCSNCVKLKQDVGCVTTKQVTNCGKQPECDKYGYVVGHKTTT